MHLSEGPIDHAEETEGVIVHFSTDTRPVLLEVLDASEFLSRLTKITATAQPGTVMTLSQRITGKRLTGDEWGFPSCPPVLIRQMGATMT
jgi:hypothetical protein